MLEPLREYALEQLAARGEAAALGHAHASYYLALAEAAVAQWDSPTAAVAIAQLDREYDNLRAVLQWARDGGDRMLGLQLAVALRRFWQRRGYYSEGRTWLEDLLALDDAPADTVALAARQRALHAAAWLASDQYDFARATQLFEQSLGLRHTLGESADQTQVLLATARQARATGQYQRATALFEEALQRHRAQGNRESASAGGLGQSLYDLALVRREQGDVAGAQVLLEEGLDLHRTIGEREGIAIGLLGLSDIARDQGAATQVREYSEQSLAISRELGIQGAIGFAVNNLALADYGDGSPTRAHALADESVSLFRNLQADSSLAEVLITKGQILQAEGHATAAYAALSEALRLAMTFGPRLMVAYALERLAHMMAEGGQTQLGVQYFAAASALRAQMGTPVRPADRPAIEHALATARAALGTDAYAAVWAEAQALPLEQVLNTVSGVVAFTANR
jgi:non-specific serine/threonine protein kinase